MPRFPRLASLSFALAGLAFAATAAPAPANFSLTSLTGGKVRLSDYRGKWVVVNFWATWCTPCLSEIPELIRFERDNPHRVLLGVDFEQIDEHQLRQFVAKNGIDYPVLLVGKTRLDPFEPLMGLPSTALVNPQGEIVAFQTGPVTAAQIEDFINRHPASKPSPKAPTISKAEPPRP